MSRVRQSLNDVLKVFSTELFHRVVSLMNGSLLY